MTTTSRIPKIALSIAAVGLLGCGGGGDDGGTAATTSGSPTSTQADRPAGRSVQIQMGEFYFKPKNATFDSGRVEITAPNVGNVKHELVIFKTDRDPGSFKVSGNRIDEENLKGAKSVGEIADVAAGKTKSGSFRLPPGRYAMICNVPGHYAAGMYGSITAK